MKTFVEDTTNSLNPGRGWYEIRDTGNLWGLADLRAKTVNVVLLEVYIGDFKTTSISAAKLTEIRNAFSALRTNGLTALFRAAYSFMESGQPTTDFEPADINIILNHIKQLAPIFVENADILCAVQAGFLGPWGEWHSSTYSTVKGGSFISFTTANMIVDALMSAVPASVPIQVRTPMYARLLSEAYRQRIGIHNDSLFSSVSDGGTYMRADGAIYAVTLPERDKELSWISNQCKQTPFTGETTDPSSVYVAPNIAILELEKVHAQHIHLAYHAGVIAKWKAMPYNGVNAFDYITRRLGYNFILKWVEFPPVIRKGQPLNTQFCVENTGFGNLTKAVDFKVILTNGKGVSMASRTTIDPRKWLKENGAIVENFGLPIYAEPGVWQVNFRLSSPFPALKNNPAYCIRLASVGVWKPATGYNYIGDVSIT